MLQACQGGALCGLQRDTLGDCKDLLHPLETLGGPGRGWGGASRLPALPPLYPQLSNEAHLAQLGPPPYPGGRPYTVAVVDLSPWAVPVRVQSGTPRRLPPGATGAGRAGGGAGGKPHPSRPFRQWRAVPARARGCCTPACSF